MTRVWGTIKCPWPCGCHWASAAQSGQKISSSDPGEMEIVSQKVHLPPFTDFCAFKSVVASDWNFLFSFPSPKSYLSFEIKLSGSQVWEAYQAHNNVF